MLKIFNINPERYEVWEVDELGEKVRFKGRFLELNMAILYLNGKFNKP